MSTTTELIKRAQTLGAKLWVEGDRLELDAPVEFPDTLVELLRQNKPEVISCLRHMEEHLPLDATSGKRNPIDQPSIGDELERVMALGAQLKRGEISAVRCGISGKRCAACPGVPCLGSEPWEDAE